MNAEHCYQIWTASNLHCTTQYDAVKYSFKIKKAKNFSLHRDRYVYQSIANKVRNTEEILNFSLSNLCKNVRYIRDASFDNWFEFQKIQDGLNYWFQQDINKIATELHRWRENDKNPKKFFINTSKDNLPRIVTWYQQGKISFQTIAIFQKFYSFLNRVPYDNLIYNDTMTFLKKSSKLLFLGERKSYLREVADDQIIRSFDIDICSESK